MRNVCIIILIILIYNVNIMAMTYRDVKPNHRLIELDVKKFNNLSPIQLNLVKKVYLRFNKVNLGITGVAILIQESQAGKYLFNPVSKDYGIMMVNLETYMSLKKIKPKYYTKIEIASILMKNDNINIEASIENMLFWKKYHRGNWIKMLASYNGGCVGNYYYSYRLFNMALAFRIWLRTHPEFKKQLKNNMYR